MRRRLEFWEVEREWRGGVEREMVEFGRFDWKWEIRVLCVRVFVRVWVEMYIGVVVVVAMVERIR